MPRSGHLEEIDRVSIRTRIGALTFASALVVAACGGGGTTPTGSAAGATSSPGAPAGAATPSCLSFADIYALVGPESTGFSDWSQATEIATALGSSTVFPSLPLSVTAPGEESGTFDSFVEITGIEGTAEERGLGEDERTVRPDYTASSNDNAIIEGISGSAGSFGWVGFAFYEENLDTVRAFQIAEEPNGTCVEPTAATIASNEYPISRDLYIYVNKAKAASNPAVAAYVDFYLADGTIDTVLQTVPYVPLTAEALAESRTAWEGAKPATASPDGSIVVSGSSTVEPISNGVAEAFAAANPGFTFAVTGPGTGDGFQQFCAGEIDIADASRKIRDDENEAGKCAAAGIEYVELKVAIDGIAVLTQK
jgi:ABC-type phosphate transport system substrate-binding protein